MQKKNQKKQVVLSASRLKTLESCSWLYYCKYVLKLPEESNDGARRGSVVHNLFECLLNPRHRKHYDALLTKGTIHGLPVIERFIKWQGKREGISGDLDHKGQNNVKMIDEMIQVGLRYDFFVENGDLQKAEEEFNYTCENGGFTIRGFIDKMAIVKKGRQKALQIWDYKTSAEKFSGEDLECNTQALMYSLYARRVRNMDAVVRFLFLRHPDDPMQELDFSEQEINGFAKYLAHITEFLKDYDYEKATSNLAGKQPYPKKGEGFKGPLVCGYAKFPGHAKKTGEPYWHCPHKFAYDYYALLNVDGEVVRTAFTANELMEDETIAAKGLKIEKRHYAGCPAHSQNLVASGLKL